MQGIANRLEAPSAIRSESLRDFRFNGTQSLNLADHIVVAGRRREDVEAQRARWGHRRELLARFSKPNRRRWRGLEDHSPIIVIQEAGLDGFWIHRALESEGIESHVVDPASIATSRRRRRAKTDSIDGEALLRALLAYKRGEPRVCAMVKAPTPKQEDSRRLCRERKVLTNERVLHVNRVKGLLFSQGFSGYEPLLAIGGAISRAEDSRCRPLHGQHFHSNGCGARSSMKKCI